MARWFRDFRDRFAASRLPAAWHLCFWSAYVLLVLLGYALNRPGRVIADSLFMVLQARGIMPLSDWHPPLLTYLWSTFDPNLGQPSSALLVQCLLWFVLPAAMLADAVDDLRNRRGLNWIRLTLLAGIAFLCVLSLFLVGFVFKDLTLVALLLILVFLLRHGFATSRPVRWLSWRGLGTAVTVVAITLVRPINAIWLLAVLLMVAIRRYPSDVRRLISHAAAASIVAAACVAAAGVIHYRLLHATKTPVAVSLITFDLAGISVRSGRDLFSELPGWNRGIPTVEACYTPKWWDTFSDWGKCREYYHNMEQIFDAKGRSFLVRWWLRAIRAHPREYLAHRLDFTRRLLTSSERPDRYFPIDNTEQALRFLVPKHVSEFQPWPNRDRVMLMPLWVWVASGPAGQPYAWLGLAAIGLALSARSRRDDGRELVAFIAFAIAATNVLMHAFLGVADSPRYLLPTLVLSLVGFIQLTRSRFNDRLA